MLKAENITKTFFMKNKEITIFNNLSIEIEDNKAISIVGKSGIGKSTLLHILGTIDFPTTGKVFYNNKEVFKFNEKKLAHFRNQNIGFVFQFHHLLPEFTALENVMIPYLVFNKDRKKGGELAEKLLIDVDLKDRMLHKPSELSGGEQQRVAIARALINKPNIVFADEPTGNLDEKTSENIHELLLKLQKDYKSTLIIVTHNEKLANQFDLKYRMTKGKILKVEE